MRRAFAVAEQEVNVYLAHVAALFVPGVRVRSLPVHPGKVGTLSEWSEAELVLLVEEGASSARPPTRRSGSRPGSLPAAVHYRRGVARRADC